MPLVHDRCICLRKTEYSETSQILTLFCASTESFASLPRAAHRRTKAGASRFDGGVDFLDVGAAVFTHDPGRELATLTEWRLLEGHLELRLSLRGIYLGLYAAELVSRLIEEHDPHPQLFDRLETVWQDLATSRREETFLAFELEMLRECGYLPELWVCAECGSDAQRWEMSFFSPARSGVICRNCEAAIPDRASINARLLRLLHTILRPPRVNGVPPRLPQLTRHQTDPLNRMLADHVEHTLGKRLRMRKYVVD